MFSQAFHRDGRRAKAKCISVFALAILLSAFAFGNGRGVAAQEKSSATLTVSGDVEKPLTITLADLKKMPSRTVRVFDMHNKKTETFDGVPLIELLKEAGIPSGERMRGAAMATYVEATASDGYRVIYALPELDPGFQDSNVIVAYAMDGAPLGAGDGPLRLVAPLDKRPARWIRMLVSIKVVRVHD